MNSNTTLLVITIVLFFVLYAAGCVAYASKGFTTVQTFLNVFRSNAGLICVACGMTCVMLTGGIDISVGSLVAMDCMIIAYGLNNWEWASAPTIIALVLVIGLVFGLFQGFCVGYLEIQPFIVSMAGLFFARGMTAVISTDQLSITAEADQLFYDMANFRIYLPFGGTINRAGKLIMPYVGIGVVIALVVLVLIFLMLRYTKFGRSLYAVGGSEQSAAMMGLDVKKTKMKAYVLSSFLCSIGGICYCMNTMSASVNQATGLEMERHRLLRHRRHPADRRRGQRDRHPVRRAHQRHHRLHRPVQRQAGLLLAQRAHRRSAVLLHRPPERVCPHQGKKEVRGELYGTERDHHLRTGRSGHRAGLHPDQGGPHRPRPHPHCLRRPRVGEPV